MSADVDFEKLVKRYYRDLYRFGFSLTGSDADAADLTQETFYIWASKGHQLKSAEKVKGWLFTTLHREFLKICRRQLAPGFGRVVGDNASELSFANKEHG